MFNNLTGDCLVLVKGLKCIFYISKQTRQSWYPGQLSQAGEGVGLPFPLSRPWGPALPPLKAARSCGGLSLPHLSYSMADWGGISSLMLMPLGLLTCTPVFNVSPAVLPR